MEDREKVSDYAKPLRLPEDCSKNKKNFTQGYFYREIGRYKNAIPSEFQWAAEDKLINKNTYEELKCQLPDSPRSTFLMVFSPDGKKVASTHGNHNVYVTDLTTGKNIQTLSGHPRTPWCIAFHPSSNQILASGCLGGQVRVWDLHGGSEVWTAESQTVIASLAFHPVDRMLVIATYNELHFWDWSQPEPFAKCSTKSGREKVRYVTFDRLGNKLITGIANPVSIPSQWDRISMVNNQPPVTSTTTPTTNINSAPITTTATTQPSNDQRSLSSWYRNFMNRCSQLVSMSCNTPTIDRGTDPMDFMDTRNSGNNVERNNNNNPLPSTSNSHSASSSSPIRFKITRSACRSYRPLSSRERFRIHSSVFKRLSNRTSLSTTSRSNTTTFTTAASTSVSQSGVFTTPSLISSPTTSSPPPSSLLRRCAFSLCPAARSWCLTLSPENTSNLFSSRNFSQSASSSGAVTNPTYTSYPDSGIFSTRETNSSFSERSQFAVVRPYRLLFDDIDEVGSTTGRSNYSDREETLTNQPRSEVRSNSSTSFDRIERLRASRQNTTHCSPERSHNRDPALQSLDDTEIEIELHRPTSGFYTRRQESESSNTSSVGADLPLATELTRNNRSSSILQLRPTDLRNVSPIRRFREDANSDGELRDSYRRENQTLSQSLMHPRPLPRFQVRSRLMQDHQSQLHLITNRETHGLNLQNNQNLRRQLSFRPGGQYVLSRHSNSPFKPRVPHQIETSTPVSSPRTDKNNPKSIKPEIPSRRSSFSASFSSSTSDIAAAASSSTTNSSSLNFAPSNLSVTNQGSSRQLPEQLNRRLFDRVKMMLRDRIRNSSENASVDSTVNYSRISDEWETDAVHLNDNASMSRGLGPRGADPMLSSASEGLDSSTETLLLPTTSVIPENTATVNNDTNLSQSELLDFWESESETVPFSLNSSLSINDILNEQSQPAQESAAQEAGETMEENFETSASNNNTQDNSDLYSPEFSMRQGIELLSLHIENMQRLCLARIEILQLQKIRGMWEDLTKQIRYFHNAIQNRSNRDNSSRSTNSSNSGEDIPILKNLAISNSPVPKPSFSSSIPSETSNNTEISNHRDAAESRKRELFRDDKKKNSEILDNEVKDKKPNLKGRSTLSSTNETEEPQPGPSGVTTTSTSRSVRNSILHLQYRVYRFLRDIIQKTRRRRDSRNLGINNFSGFSRQNHCFRIRNSSRMKFRTHRHNRHLPESNSRSRTLNRELENIWQNWRNEKLISKSEQPTPSTSNADDLNQPSTSKSTSSEACQSCGQRKRPNKEFCRPKRRNINALCEPDIAGSASKVLKNNVGERSEAPNKKELDEETPSTSYETNSSTTQSPETSTNELLKQMLQTMETMLRFQQEAFRRTKELTADHSAKNHPPSTPSSDDDSDSDQNNSNKQSEMFMKDLLKNFRSTREFIRNSMQDIAQLRAKRLLEFMVKSLNQFFGKNFGHLNQVLDEQIFSLYMLLDLALELTDLLLNHLNTGSRNIQRNWNTDAAEDINVRSRERISLSSRTSGEGGRIRERNRNFGRSSCHSSETAINEDNIRHRPLANSFSPSHSKLISTRLNSSTATNPNSDRLSNSLLSSYCRRKRRTARMSTSLPIGWYGRGSRTSVHSNNTTLPTSSRTINANSINNNYRSFRFGRRISGNESTRTEFRSSDYEINNNSSNDTNNNSSLNNNRNNVNNYNNDNRNRGRIDDSGDNNSNNISINNNFINYYFPNNSGTNSSDGGNNVIIVTGLNSGSDIANGSIMHGVNRNNNTELNNSGQNSSNTPLSQNPLPPFRSMEVILSRNESGDLSLRDERPIFWIRYGGNNESPGSSNINDSHSRVNSFTVPVVQVNDVPVSDVSLLNQPRHRPQSPVPRVPEDIWRWRALRPRFLHPRYGGPNPFDDQDTNDAPENIHYYRILSTSAVSHLGVYTLDPMIITDAPLSPHHRIQAWDFSKMNIPDISDREANGVVPECKIHNDASVDVSNDGHLLVTLLPSGRLSVTTMLGVYSLDWSSLGQLLYRTSFEQNAVSVSLSPTNRHLLVGLASRPVVRDRTNMAQIFRLEGGRPSPNGGSWQSGRGRLVHMRDLEQTRETNIMSLNCIRWAPGAGQGLVYGTNTGQLKVLR